MFVLSQYDLRVLKVFLFQFQNDTCFVFKSASTKVCPTRACVLHASRQPITSTVSSWHNKHAACLLAHWGWWDQLPRCWIVASFGWWYESLKVRYPDLRFSPFWSRIVKHFPDSGFLNVRFCCFSSSLGFRLLSWTTEAIWRHHFWLFGLSRWRPLASTRPSKYEGVLEGVGLIFLPCCTLPGTSNIKPVIWFHSQGLDSRPQTWFPSSLLSSSLSLSC